MNISNSRQSDLHEEHETSDGIAWLIPALGISLVLWALIFGGVYLLLKLISSVR